MKPALAILLACIALVSCEQFDEDELHDYDDVNIEYLLRTLFAKNGDKIAKYPELKRYFGNDSIPKADIFNHPIDTWVVPEHMRRTVSNNKY